MTYIVQLSYSYKAIATATKAFFMLIEQSLQFVLSKTPLSRVSCWNHSLTLHPSIFQKTVHIPTVLHKAPIILVLLIQPPQLFRDMFGVPYLLFVADHAVDINSTNMHTFRSSDLR